MADISPNALAAGNFVGVKNKQFAVTADVLARKIVIVGTYDPAILTLTDNVPILVTSAADVASKTGFGFMLHRLAIQSFLGSKNGIETWIIPQSEAGGAVVAEGTITYVATSVSAGTVYLYIAGIAVPFIVAEGDDETAVALACVAAVNAENDLPVTAGAVAGVVTMTSKTKGSWGNDISITFNWGADEDLPDGLTSAVVVDMASGTGVPDIQDALDGLGTGDNQNQDFFTDFVYGYGQETASLDALSTYNGVGNDFVGNYSKQVARPFRTLNGDVAAGSGGLSTLIALGDGRKTDRTNGTVAVPGSPNHPEEIAALAMGIQASVNNIRAEESSISQLLPGIIAGALADQWTDTYTNRDTAVKAGISPTAIQNGNVVLQNVVTYYHPDSVPDSSNGYRSQRNISIIQNVLDATRLNFSQEKWQGISIVNDVTNVTNVTSRLKSRDTDAVLDDLVALSQAFQGNAWIYIDTFADENLKSQVSVVIRSGNTGFDYILPIILSGEGGILNGLIEFDTSIAVLLG